MNPAASQSLSITRISRKLSYSRGKLFGFLIIGALLAFELFNYSTTEYALNDLLGGLQFASLRWATILAIAFCAIDFAGIARLFTPQQSENGLKEVWYLFGAWLLAACMNAMLTWWGVALAIVNHQSLGSSVISHDKLLTIVPIFVAILVWLIRVLIIGTFSVAGTRLFSQAEAHHRSQSIPVMHRTNAPGRTAPAQTVAIRPVAKPSPDSARQSQIRPEPTYHPAGMNSYKSTNHQ
ncbi:MAG: hypothetical protein C3F13_11315 [Anaerolineales bacterium]|nr:MAG: hypothetical protein C3F13_11315 [Anaerolineales bacterium]